MKILISSIVVFLCLSGLFSSAMAEDSRIIGKSIESDPIDCIVGACQIIPNGEFATLSENGLSPIDVAMGYLQQYEHKLYEQQRAISWDSVIIAVSQEPKHGELVFDGNGRYTYAPETGYLGNDSAALLLDIGGIKVKVIYFFQAIDTASVGEGLDEALCDYGHYWKISSTLDTDGNSTINSVEYLPSTVTTSASVTDTATLVATLEANLLSDFPFDASNVTVTFADLPGAAVGHNQ